jgi:parallel beta-helix repeat protein
MAASINGCALKRFTEMKSYDEFPKFANSFWANIYFTFKKIEIPGYGQLMYKNSVWTPEDGPVVVDQNLFILPGVTLTIEPGTKVLFGEDVRITSRGLIKAQGTKELPILFTWKEEDRNWSCIEFLNATGENPDKPGSIVFKHCIVEFGKGLRVNSSSTVITDSVFRHNVSSAIQLEYASGAVLNNWVYSNSTERQVESGNGAGIKVFTNRSVKVENNIVHDNVSTGGRDGGGGIYAFAYDGGNVAVLNNRVVNNRSDRKGGGIFAYDALVEGNRVEGNVSAMTGGGIYALQAVLRDNVVTGNRSDEGGGIFSKNAEVIHNLIRSNQAAKGSGIFHLGSGAIEKNSLMENSRGDKGIDAAIFMLGNASVRRNNIVAGDGFALRFQSHNLSPDLVARENYWGTDNPDIIERAIYDWLEDSGVGLVDWKMFASDLIDEAYAFPDDASKRYTPVVVPMEPGTVRGAVEKNSIWGDGSVSSFKVSGNLLIAQGSTLTIAKNSSLVIGEGVSIRIRGQLLGQGEKGKPVIFTGDPETPWGRLLFENRSIGNFRQVSDDNRKSELRYCIVENGTGIEMDGKGADLFNCRIQNHRNTGVRAKEVAVTIKDCLILNNTSDSDGGGIYAYGSKSIDIIGNTVKNNRAVDGGGIFAYGHQSNVGVDMRYNTVQGNSSQGDGGGIWACRSAMVENTIIGNQTKAKGGGIYASFAKIHNNTVKGNTALEGGGVYGESNNAFIGNTIVKNTSSSGMGAGVCLNYWGMSKDNKVFSNNLVKDNRTQSGQGAGGVSLKGAIDFAHNVIFNNSDLQLDNLTPLSGGEITAQQCFWGTTEPEKIDKLIRDGRDDPTLSLVHYSPVARTEAVIRKTSDKESANP